VELNTLQTITKRTKRRLGQGHGSGRGKTAGRGTKGQKARGHISLSFEGGALSYIKRLPFRRGKGRNKAIRREPLTVRIERLNSLPKNTIVTKETLLKHNIIDVHGSQRGVKIVDGGQLQVPVTVHVPLSKSAAKKIEKAGGKVFVTP